MTRAVSPSSIWFELTVSSHVLLSSPAWPLWSSHSSRVDAHIFLLYGQVTAFGCSLGRCAGFLHTSAYERGRGSCLARGLGSAVVLCWQASVVKGFLPVLYLAKELSQGLGCSGTGFVLPREGCAVCCISGGRGNYIFLASSGEANKIGRQVSVQRTGVLGNGTKGREGKYIHLPIHLIRAAEQLHL